MALTIPGTHAPTNLHLTPDQINWQLDGDTVEWLRHLPEEVERGEKLYVLYHKGQPEPYVIMEADCLDHDSGRYVDMFVMRTDHLGSDTYLRLRRARKVPLLKRLEWAEKENQAHEMAEKQRLKEEMYETLGGPMLRELDRNGFLPGPRGTSYPKRGPAHRRATAENRSSGGVLLP